MMMNCRARAVAFLTKRLLEEYAQCNQLPDPTYFADGGISGVRFGRLSFIVIMMNEVEVGRG